MLGLHAQDILGESGLQSRVVSSQLLTSLRETGLEEVWLKVELAGRCPSLGSFSQYLSKVFSLLCQLITVQPTTSGYIV